MTHFSAARPAALILLATLTACNDSAPPTQAAPPQAAPAARPTVRDSAGIQIVQHGPEAIAAAPSFELDSTPSTVLDEGTSDVELGKVTRPLLLSANRIALFDDGAIHIIATNGEVEERIGRRGEGPGEFQSGRLSRGAGDTLLVYDIETARISVVAPGAGVLRTIPFTAQLGKVVFTPLGLGGRDTVLLGSNESVAFRDPKSTSLISPWYVGRLVLPDEAPIVLDSLGAWAVVQYGPGFVGQRYGGAGALAGWNGRMLLVNTRTREMRVLGGSGRLEQLIRIPGTRRATDAATIARDVEAEIAWLRTRSNSGPIRWDTTRVFAQLRNAPPGDSLPLIERVLIGADGLAWFKDGGYTFADSTWSWTALRPDGTIAGRLTGRGRDPVQAFGTKAVLLKSEDEDGFTVFRVYRLLPTPR